MQDCVLNRD